MEEDREAREVFFEDIREKRKMIPPPRSKSKIGPKHVVLPGDRLDKRLYPEYRASRVISYSLKGDSQMDLEGKFPTWREFKKLPEERQRAIMMELIRLPASEAVKYLEGAKVDGIYYYRKKFGLTPQASAAKVQWIPGTNLVKFEPKKEEKEMDTKTEVSLSINKEGDSKTIAQTLRSIADLVESQGGTWSLGLEVDLNPEE